MNAHSGKKEKEITVATRFSFLRRKIQHACLTEFLSFFFNLFHNSLLNRLQFVEVRVRVGKKEREETSKKLSSRKLAHSISYCWVNDVD